MGVVMTVLMGVMAVMLGAIVWGAVSGRIRRRVSGGGPFAGRTDRRA